MSEEASTFEEFINRLFEIEREQKLLAEDRKDLMAEFKDKLAIKEVMAAIRIAKIKIKINSSDEEIENMVNQVKRNINV